MKSILKTTGILALATLLLASCADKSPREAREVASSQTQAAETEKRSNPNKGKHVPNNLVCMVNDAYMAKQQIEVPFEGKTYYGCCNMCKEKIPKDESVRYAVDPHSLKKISKADAYIVVIGDNDEVAYFENEQNFHLFLQDNAL